MRRTSPAGYADLRMPISYKLLPISAVLASLSLLAGCSSDGNEPGRFTVGGTVTGLAAGNTIVLRNNGIDNLTVNSDGAYAFPRTLTEGDAYAVTVLSPPTSPNQTCLIDNAEGPMPGGNVTYVAINCYSEIALQATPGNGRILLSWNPGDFTSATFNLCQAEAPIDSGVANCAAHDGGILIPNADSPYDTGVLELDTPYWFLLEAVHPGERRTQSNMMMRSIPSGLDAPLATLNDTGVDWCADNDTNIASTGSFAEKTVGCNQVAATHPEQDAEQGRDAAARAGTLIKIGTGSSGFDFTRICNSGEAAGQGACPVAPLIGGNANDWGCVRDNVTGLMWEVKPGGFNQLRSIRHLYTWFDPAAGGNQGVQNGGFCAAIDGSCANPAYETDTHAYVQAVNAGILCGQSDWRLPTIDELHSISDKGRINPAISQTTFPDTTNQGFWSAATVAGFADEAWYLDFTDGNDRWDTKGRAHSIRVVRGQAWAPATAADIPSASAECTAGLAENTPSSDFTAIEDGGIVRHVPTGLEWQRCARGQAWSGSTCTGAPSIHTWRQALSDAGAIDGWRLPNVNELRTIAERCRVAPAVNQQVFPNAPGAAFLSASPAAANPNEVWIVHFLSGIGNRIDKSRGAHVRLVRDGQ